MGVTALNGTDTFMNQEDFASYRDRRHGHRFDGHHMSERRLVHRDVRPDMGDEIAASLPFGNAAR